MTLDFGNLHLTHFETELRPLSVNDAQGLSHASSEDTSIYKFNNSPVGLEQTEAYIETALAQRAKGSRFPFTIIWKNRIVGTTSFADYQPWSWPSNNPNQRQDTPDVLEIGYTWLGKSAQRTGCNTAAKYLLLNHAFEVFNVHRVSIQTDERNDVSRKAIERIGAKLEGIKRFHKVGADGNFRNSAQYSIVKNEWGNVKSALLQKL